ncbi:hypothetical protein N0V86_009895 [Didymella sp. IMI 355093]|nr:hypothetical protein N0V86_009895 [Didymella sp. IMI 355093]
MFSMDSWYLESILGKAREGEFPAIAYVGSNDLRYFLFMFGAIKAGYKMLYLSPRNSVAGHVNVLEKASCKTLLMASHTQMTHVLESRKMGSIVVPELDFFLNETSVPIYSYTKTFSQARGDPCLVLHTTGSTGLPKPITWKLEILSTYEAWRTIPSIDDYVPTTEIYQEARRVYNAMPLFHTSGLNLGITFSLLLGLTTVLGAANVVPHAAYVDDMQKYTAVDAVAGPPSIFEDLSMDAESLKRFGRLRYVLACGAPLSQSAGEVLSMHTRVISNFGATETACLPRLAPAIEDWAYFYWHPSHSGIEMRESIDGLYELFLVKKEELREYQGIFSTFPDLSEYSMNDLYSKHPDPTKPFLYRWCGRADDIIVLSNGEKLAPALMEAGLRSSPRIQGAMVVGRGRFQPAALVDVGPSPPIKVEDRYLLIEELMPAIEEANKHAPAHGKLDPYHLLFVDSSRPINYLGQGKIQRHQTYNLYQQDIEDLYESAEFESMRIIDRSRDVDFRDRAGLARWLAEIIATIAPNLPKLGNGDLFFSKGMDSLQVIRLVREIKSLANAGSLTQLYRALSPKTVYTNPSIDKLVQFLQKEIGMTRHLVAAESDESAESSESGTSDSEDLDVMENLLRKYVRRLPLRPKADVAAVGGWTRGPVPEAPIRDLSASAPTGYGQSKLIAEYLLDEATRISGVRTAVCRVGIVAGPVAKEEGLWNVHEYIPSSRAAYHLFG